MGCQKKEISLNLRIKKYTKNLYIWKIVIFIKFFKNKIKYSKFPKLEEAIKQISLDIKNEKKNKKINLIFSPCAASFDNFKNFEERGKYFNYLISRYKIKNAR